MANIRVLSGSLPVGVEDIEPSTDGSSPLVLATPRGSLSAVFPLIFQCDTEGYQHTGDIEIGAVDTRVRFSVDGSTWGFWGAGVTVPGPITYSGVAVFVQTRGFVTDTVPLSLKLLVGQGGISAPDPYVLSVASESAGLVDVASMFSIGSFGLLSEFGSSDFSGLSYGGLLVSIPTCTEFVPGTELATISLVGVLSESADFDVSSDDCTVFLVSSVPVESSSLDGALGVDSSSVIGVFPFSPDPDQGLSNLISADAASAKLILRAPVISSMTAGDGSASFSIGSISGATAYDYRYKLTSGNSWTEVHGVNIASTVSCSGLTNDSSYDFEARCVNGDGDGTWSSITSVTPAGSTSYYVNWSFSSMPSGVSDFPDVGDIELVSANSGYLLVSGEGYGGPGGLISSSFSVTRPFVVDFKSLSYAQGDGGASFLGVKSNGRFWGISISGGGGSEAFDGVVCGGTAYDSTSSSGVTSVGLSSASDVQLKFNSGSPGTFEVKVGGVTKYSGGSLSNFSASGCQIYLSASGYNDSGNTLSVDMVQAYGV